MSERFTIQEIFERIGKLLCASRGQCVREPVACGWCEPCELWELVERYRREQGERQS